MRPEFLTEERKKWLFKSITNTNEIMDAISLDVLGNFNKRDKTITFRGRLFAQIKNDFSNDPNFRAFDINNIDGFIFDDTYLVRVIVKSKEPDTFPKTLSKNNDCRYQQPLFTDDYFPETDEDNTISTSNLADYVQITCKYEINNNRITELYFCDQEENEYPLGYKDASEIHIVPSNLESVNPINEQKIKKPIIALKPVDKANKEVGLDKDEA